MILKIVLLMLALLNGGWMIFDGIHVIRKGKYYGPPTPGAWSKIVSSLGVDPLSIGPVFVILGLLWFVGAIGIFVGFTWGWVTLAGVSIATLWYIKVGTIISIFTLTLLIFFKSALGYI